VIVNFDGHFGGAGWELVALELISLSPLQAVGIPVALVGSVFLATGAHYQQRGVAKSQSVEGETVPGRLTVREIVRLLHRPSWLVGTGMLGLAVVFQLVSLFLAPLTVVQPLGALALVITAITTARSAKRQLSGRVIRAILLCVGGVGAFVTIAAVTTTTVPIHDTQLLVVVIILGIVLAACGILFLRLRGSLSRTIYVAGAGILFGFVATLAKVLITRIQTIIDTGFHLEAGDWLTIVCLVGLAGAAVLGSYFVQIAYATGSPDVVVAGLTVIDPMVGVTIGIVVLGEASAAPVWAVAAFVATGAVAILGVIQLARSQPSLRATAEHPGQPNNPPHDINHPPDHGAS
jgi:drug/metabolite transporter (DMT)-like permease